jgi:hypothetical protein
MSIVSIITRLQDISTHHFTFLLIPLFLRLMSTRKYEARRLYCAVLSIHYFNREERNSPSQHGNSFNSFISQIVATTHLRGLPPQSATNSPPQTMVTIRPCGLTTSVLEKRIYKVSNFPGVHELCYSR